MIYLFKFLFTHFFGANMNTKITKTAKYYIPQGYTPVLDAYDTQRAIEYIKNNFQNELCSALNLKRVSAPLFVTQSSGLNDNLSGSERPVSFDIPATSGDAQVVQSLAKWKRLALKRYNFPIGKGLYTDMNAIRRDEDLDNIHSVYVDQWDWEKIITKQTRTENYLKLTVQAIVDAICNTADRLKVNFPQLDINIPRETFFITSQELEDMYPDLTSKQRENEIVKKHRTVFIMKIGAALASGKPHDSRAPDYDDWELNGDLLFWHDQLGIALEISSMGIRVDEETLDRQLTIAGCDERRKLPFHQMLLAGELPLTIGGGIGQSRLCMLMMGCIHIGQVQSSIWDENTINAFKDAGIMLL